MKEILNPEVFCDKNDRKLINQFVSDYPEIKPSIIMSDCFGGEFYDYLNSSLPLFVLPEKFSLKEGIRQSLGLKFFETIKNVFPELKNPLYYNQDESLKIDSFCRDKVNKDLTFQSPFDSFISLREFSKEMEISIGEILSILSKEKYKYGFLELEFFVKIPSNTYIKKAIRSSVHENDGGASLFKESINGNVQRIRSNRRMIGVRTIMCDPKDGVRNGIRFK